PVSDIQLGDSIRNQADIYFDFNAPIVTNLVTTTFVDELSISDRSKLQIVLYPNPTSGVINFRSEVPIDRVELYSVLGQRLLAKAIQHKTRGNIDFSSLPQGTYFVRVFAEGATDNFQVIKR
ncbi:MAG: T9SS type A sorting domain-containing protein, partial [Bacteroidota bacterium]